MYMVKATTRDTEAFKDFVSLNHRKLLGGVLLREQSEEYTSVVTYYAYTPRFRLRLKVEHPGRKESVDAWIAEQGLTAVETGGDQEMTFFHK